MLRFLTKIFFCCSFSFVHSPASSAPKSTSGTEKNDTVTAHQLLVLAASLRDKAAHNDQCLDTALLLATRSLKISQKNGDLLRQGKCYDLISQLYNKKRRYGDAVNTEKNAVKLYDLIPDYNRLGDAYTQLAGYFNHNNDVVVTQKINFLKDALAAYSKSGNKVSEAKTYERIGNMYCINGEQSLAIKSLNGALSIYQSIHYKNQQDVYHLLNESYDELGNYKQAVIYGLQALKIAAAVGDTSIVLASIYNHLGKTYRNLGQMNKAQYYERYALKYARLNPDADTTNRTVADYTIIALNLASIYESEHKETAAVEVLQTIKTPDLERRATLYALFLHIYTQWKRYDQAWLYYNKLKDILPQVGAMSYVNEGANSSIVSYLFERKQYNRAREKIWDIEHVRNYDFTKAKLIWDQHWLFKIDSAEGNYLSAIQHSELEQRMRDSLMTREKNRNILQLEVEYETDKKEREIKLKSQNIQLLTKQSQLQRASLQKAALIRDFTVTGIVMLAILLALGYNRYQIKQKNNLKLEAQQKLINNKNKILEVLISDKDELLKEKEWLLKEIHHRVKNNLQIVISLLNTQSVYLKNSEALEAIRESQHRMRSISLIHQKLYQSDNMAVIKMDEYICELVEYLQDSFDTNQNVEIILNIKPVSLDVVQAVPIGLIINEAITNAFKYAFKPNVAAQIIVALDEREGGTLVLTISDNGCGLPRDFKIENCNSLGMCLIKGLSKQLHGQAKVLSHNGLTVQVIIPQHSGLNGPDNYQHAGEFGFVSPNAG
jgi:two-component sensor histidine kinase/tetratricopeptide (TPR) repeat protein